MASFITELEIFLSEQKEKFDNRPKLDLWSDSNIMTPNPEEPEESNRVSPIPSPNPSKTEMMGPMPLALMEVINDPRIIITEEMIPIINDEEIVVTRNGQPAKKMSGRDVIRRSGQFSRSNILPDLPGSKKKKRKVSKYQKEFGKQLKKLKAKHPRTKITQLMKRAHRATRKVMK